MARLLQRLFQRRYGRAGLRDLVALGQQGGARNGADRKLLLDDAEFLQLRIEHFVGRLQLRAGGSFTNRRDHDVRRERDVGRFQLITLVIDRRLQVFQFAARRPEDIKRIGNVERTTEDVKDFSARREGGNCRCVLPFSAKLTGNTWVQQATGFGPIDFLGLPQGRLGAGHAGIVFQRGAHQLIELGRMKHGPPIGRDIFAGHETLGIAGKTAGRIGLRRRSASVCRNFRWQRRRRPVT